MRRRRSTSYYTNRRSYYDTRRQPRRRRRGSSPWPRFFYGVTVLVGGITGAWHYHKTAEAPVQPQTVAQADTADEDVTLQLVAPTPVVPDAPWDAPQTATQPNPQVETPKPRASLDSASAPPNLAAAFEPLAIAPTRKPDEAEPEKSRFEPVSEPLEQEEDWDYESDSGPRADDDEHNVKQATPKPSEDDEESTEETDTVEDTDREDSSTATSPPPTVEAARLRQHRVADGDTLAGLAAKYLGSADRWRVIYDANRASLSSTEWLPVGVVLTIPAAGPNTSSAVNPTTDMVPIPTNLLYPDSKN